MRKQKIVALLTLTALGLSTPGVASAGNPADNAGGVSMTENVTGGIKYADTEIYTVTLPTAGCFNFAVDPQGILSATDSTTYSEELYPEGTAGLIVATEGTGAYINNKSAVPIKLSVDAYVTKDLSDSSASSVNLVDLDRAASINAGIDNNMLLTFDITHDDVDQTTFADATTITSDTVNPDVIAITKNGKADPTDPAEKGTELTFALNGANYNYVDGGSGNYTYELDTADAANVGDSVGIRLGGYVNTEADWSKYAGASPEDIIVSTVFSFDKLSTDYDQAALDGRAHGVLADVEPQYFAGMGVDEDGNPTGAPAVGEMECSSADVALEIPFDFGTGTKEVTVTDVDFGGTPVDAADYRVKNYVISFKTATSPVKDTFAAAAENNLDTDANPDGYTPVDVTITTSDGQSTVVTLYVY